VLVGVVVEEELEVDVAVVLEGALPKRLWAPVPDPQPATSVKSNPTPRVPKFLLINRRFIPSPVAPIERPGKAWARIYSGSIGLVP
jgi:hypothetical protein